jgi:predicted oxidoreductase
MAIDADAIIVGGGLAGLVAAAELADAGKRVILLEQEGENSLGGQAFWSLGGLFFVDSPEQRRMRIRDSRELALQDWLGSAQFDRPEDYWPRQVAEAFIDFAAGEMRPWLRKACAGFRSSAGRNAAARWRMGMAIRCRGFMSPGGPDPGWWHRSRWTLR